MNSVLPSALEHLSTGAECSSAPDGPDELAQWCRWQARLLPQAVQLVVYQVQLSASAADGREDTESAAGRCVAQWPQNRPIAHLQPLLDRVLAEQRCLSARLNSTQAEAAVCIAIPVPAITPTHVVLVTTRDTSVAASRAIRRLVDWGSYWLRSANPDVPGYSSQRLIRAVTAHESLASAAQELVDQIASIWPADRVSFGVADKSPVCAIALSNNPIFDRRMAGVVAIERAMDEALAQQKSVDSQPAETTVQRQQQALCARSGSAYCLSIPLLVKDQVLGVLTVECDQVLQADESSALSEMVQELIPVLNLLRREERTLTQRWWTLVRSRWSLLTGREHTGRQLCAMGVVVFFLCSVLFEGPHRIAARASIEGSDRQVITAAHEGFVHSAAARAGETVVQGQVLAQLDNRELLLSQQQWQTELDKHDKSYAQALADGNRAELSMLRAQRVELQAELKLVGQQLERNVVRAPFAGVLISGDLNQQLGAPVEAGQTLFEITSLESYRLLLDIDEHAIAQVQAGQSGTLRLASMPNDTYELSVMQVMPVAQSKNGRTVFRMQAELSEDDHRLRPGMQGVAKINIGESSWLWLWTHRFVHRVRLWLWSVGV